MYMVTLVRIQRGVLYKWSRQRCTGYIGTHTQRGAVQMEPAEVYRVSAWTREAKNGEGAPRRTVKSRASPRDCFLFFRLDKVRVPYKSGSTSCEKCPLTCKDGLCGKIGMLCL